MENSALIQKIISFITTVSIALATVVGWFGFDSENIFMKFDLCGEEQEITGWGASAAWWAQIAGDNENAEEYAKLFYSEEGLGLNIYRYNVGAGEKDNPNSRLDMNSWRPTESFLVYNEETDEYEYDWSKDAAAQRMLDLSLSYGCIDTVVLFANSPHYSMTVSGQASGGLEPAQSNLRKDCYDDYADYMLDIAEYFIGKGVPVKYISPVNEPQWDWGGDEVGQEGCHYEVDEVIELAKVFAAEIKERGLDVKLSLAESGEIGVHAVECLNKIYRNKDIVDVLGTYSYHSYWSDNALRKKVYGDYIRAKYPDIHLEMSEWCELPAEHTVDQIEAALLAAHTISQDMALTGCNSWCSWVAVNGSWAFSDGLIGANDDCSEYIIGKRYYAMAHYSKFIPVGSHMVDFDTGISSIAYLLDDSIDISAYKTPDGDYVAVIVNEGKAKKINFDMKDYTMSVYTTDTERNLELTEQTGGAGSITIGEKSISTVVFEK